VGEQDAYGGLCGTGWSTWASEPERAAGRPGGGHRL